MYEPEIGQALFGNPTGEFTLPETGEAILHHVLYQMELVYGNAGGKDFDRPTNPDLLRSLFPLVDYRPYFWGDDEAEESLPNFSFQGIEIRWYKHPHRGLSCNREMTAREWDLWHCRLLDYLNERDFTRDSTGRSRPSKSVPCKEV